MINPAMYALAFAISLSMIVFGIWYGFLVWDECREAGHSALYCVRMVTR